jgi:cell wall-associated NlpC family hydrolase
MQLLKEYALSFVGIRYTWGGSHPEQGYDCSGFVQELLKSAGLDPPGDQTAQALFNHFEKNATWNVRQIGSLAFFGASVSSISHVAMLLDPYRMIEAGGGGSKTLTPADAIRDNAFVRVRLVASRKDLVAILKPNYSGIGVI